MWPVGGCQDYSLDLYFAHNHLLIACFAVNWHPTQPPFWILPTTSKHSNIWKLQINPAPLLGVNPNFTACLWTKWPMESLSWMSFCSYSSLSCWRVSKVCWDMWTGFLPAVWRCSNSWSNSSKYGGCCLSWLKNKTRFYVLHSFFLLISFGIKKWSVKNDCEFKWY